MNKDKYLDIAKDFYSQNYADALCGFVAGSIMRGEGYPHSDIDLVILYGDDFTAVRRESHEFQGVPIEVFIHNTKGQDYFMSGDRNRGVPTMPNMIAEGIVIGKDQARAEMQKDKANHILSLGPKPYTNAEFNRGKYMITDMCDDLRDARPQTQITGILCVLYTVLGDFYLRANGRWSGTSKSLVKAIGKYNADMAARYTTAFDAGFAGSVSPVLTLADDILKPHGGFYWAGDKQAASDAWKEFEGMNFDDMK